MLSLWALQLSLKNNQPIKLAHNWSSVWLLSELVHRPGGTSAVWPQIWPQTSSVTALMKGLRGEGNGQEGNFPLGEDPLWSVRWDQSEIRWGAADRERRTKWAGWRWFEKQFTKWKNPQSTICILFFIINMSSLMLLKIYWIDFSRNWHGQFSLQSIILYITHNAMQSPQPHIVYFLND